MLPAPHFLSPGGTEYSGIGNWVTLAPPSRAVILLTPCFFTSSMRRIECSGRKVRLTPANSALDALLAGVEHDRRALAEHQLLDLDETKQLPVA